jgi:L,D-transpeptidase catalytic domain
VSHNGVTGVSRKTHNELSWASVVAGRWRKVAVFSKVRRSNQTLFWPGSQLSTEQARRMSRHRRPPALSGCAAALGIVMAVALASPAAARTKSRHQQPAKETERISKEPFGAIQKGPLQIFISLDQQKLHFYSDGSHVTDQLVATGVPGHPTPLGVFSVISRDRYHRSNIYSGAPMPFMQRITWSGVAMHEGVGLGHPASHGCIRMPHDFAARLWTLRTLGMRVIIARGELKPVVFADAHLFVHKAMPPAAATVAPAAPETTQNAQTRDETKATDAVDPPPPPAPPAAAAAAPVAPEPTTTAQFGGENKDSVAPQLDAPATAGAAAIPVESVKSAETGGTTKTTDVAGQTATDKLRGSVTTVAPPPDRAADTVPVPATKPTGLVETGAATHEPNHGPIAIFVSRKEKRIYVRQNFTPLFEAPVAIGNPDQAFGTVVFTALDLLDDGTTFRWNVVSLPGVPPRVKRETNAERRGGRHEEPVRPVGDLPPPQAPADVLARIEIPQDAVDRISALMVPGSSLVVSDQGLGEETGEGTDFIVVTR